MASDHSGHAVTASHATLHCLLGCSIGEVLGVTLAALMSFGVVGRMAAGTTLAFVFGLHLAALPVMKREGVRYFRAMKIIFWGEVASIIAMEIAMNGADYLFGGMQAGVTDWRFWAGFVVMLPAGYAAAFPVNYVLIRLALKEHHH